MTEAVGVQAQAQRAAEPPDPRRWISLAIVLTASFMVLLDISIVNVAIPAMQGNLGASFAEVQLVLAGYALSYAVVLITGGRLGDLYGRKRLFMLGMAGFTVASALCGLAQSPTMLISSRVLQGLMAALMYPQVLSVIQVSFPPRERGAAFGTFGAVIGLATIMGPVLGGVIIRDDVTGQSWRFVFLVNVPVGIASLVAAARLMRESRAPIARRLDLVGVLIASVGLFLLVYPLVEGRDQDWAPWIFGMLAASLPVLALFALYERRAEARGWSPLLELHMFRDRAFTVGSLVSFVFIAGVPAFFFTFSIMLQIGLGFSALHAGLTTVPFAVGSAVASGLSVRLAPRLGKRLLLAGSGILMVGMSLLIVTVHAQGTGLSSLVLAPTLLLSGFGLGCVVAPLITVILSGIRGADAGSASGAITTVQQVGGALGVAVIGVIFFGLLGGRAPEVGREVALDQGTGARIAAAQAVPQPVADGIVSGLVDCFAQHARAKDPQQRLACDAPPPGRAPTAATQAAVASLRTEALGRSFLVAEERALLFEIAAFAATFALVLMLPRGSGRQAAGRAAAH